jgi:hypothetical protein
MVNVNFHLRSLTKKNAQRVWAVFFADNVRVKIDTNQSIKPDDWNKSKQKALTSHKESDRLNRLLREMEDYIDSYISNLKLKKQRFYKDELQNEFNLHFKIGDNKPEMDGEVVDFISFIEKYLESRKDLGDGTMRTRRSALRKIIVAFNLASPKLLKQWGNMSNAEKRVSDILIADKQLDFDQIDYNWMRNYHTWLLNYTFTSKKNGVKTIEHLKKNNIAKEIKVAKHFANVAVDAGYIHNLSFRGLKCKWEDADNIHLNWDEINKLKALDLDPNSKLGKVRNLFVFNCYCGLRYSDLYKLDKNRFTRVGGQLFLTLRMKKTDEIITFPILKSAEEILKIYNYNLPDVHIVTFNITIEDVCLKAGITTLETKRETRGGTKLIITLPKYQMVSSHTGRRSFATNFEADEVPLKELMAVTGHATEAAFNRYVKKKAETKFAGFLAAGANR